MCEWLKVYLNRWPKPTPIIIFYMVMLANNLEKTAWKNMNILFRWGELIITVLFELNLQTKVNNKTIVIIGENKNQC